jgi:PilZ domain
VGLKPPPKDSEMAPDAAPERIACGERCEFDVEGVAGTREGLVWNLSVAGVYLVLQSDIPEVGAVVRVSLWLPGDPRPIRAQGEIVWSNPPSPFKGCGANAPRFPPGCGLKFVVIAADDLVRIQTRVDSVHPFPPERPPR